MNNFRNRNRNRGGNGGKKKCFVSFDLPKEVLREVLRVQEELKKKNFFSGRFVDPETYSVTLKSLGVVDFGDLVLIKRRLRGIDFSSFEISLSAMEVLGGKNPQALYVQLQGGGLWKLRAEICRVLGRALDEELKPQLTLCRINRFGDRLRFAEELKKVCVCKKKFEAKGFSLVEGMSRRDGRGVFYRGLDEFRLR